jgi:hypothetical protein
MFMVLAQYADYVGIIGVFLLLLAYCLLTMSKITAQSFKYQLLNFFGSLLILFSLMYAWNLAAAIIEVVWMLISLMGMYRLWRHTSV